MKKLGILMAMIGIFALVGSVFASTAEQSASTVDQLQPASDITYTETLVVPSLKVGAQGVGGVTFFNGTIINSTTTDGANNPVTFGDDVRIDGEIFRNQKGSDPLKVSDSIIPTTSLINNLGSEDNRWANVYALVGDFAGNLGVQGFADVNGFLNVEEGAYIGREENGDIGVNIYSNGDTQINGYLEVNGIVTIGQYSSESNICDSHSSGSMYFNSSDNHFYGCNGSDWVRLDN